MQITLNEQQTQFITTQLASGNFTHPQEVITTALKLLEKLQTEYADWLTETRTQLETAAIELDHGDSLDGETFVAAILERFQSAKNDQH